jgi:DNA-binding CsgD family transcriptional regulator
MGLAWKAATVQEAIVRLARSGLDSESFRFEAAAQLRRAVPFDAWCAPTADPATLLVGRAVGAGFPPGDSARAFEIEYQEPDFGKFDRLATATRKATGLLESTARDLERSARWRDVFSPLGLGDELRVALRAGSDCWGYLALHRDRGSAGFTPDEIDFVARLSTPLAVGLRSAIAAPPKIARRLPDLPAIIILDRNLHIVETTGAAFWWLEETSNTTPTLGRGLPDPVYAVISRLRANHCVANLRRPPRVRLQIRSGEWIVISATPVISGGLQGRVAVIFEGGRPSLLAPLLARAYRLTRRENEVTRLIVDGCSTAQIAERMHVLPNTVQDHIQAVYLKLGVRSRVELVARIHGSLDRGGAWVTSAVGEAADRKRKISARAQGGP